MATVVQANASMETLAAPSTTNAPKAMDMHHANEGSDFRHRATITSLFVLFFSLWYIFSPYLPQTLKQYFWAIVH